LVLAETVCEKSYSVLKVKIRKIQKKILECRENSVQGVRKSRKFEYLFGALKLVKQKFLREVIAITNGWPVKEKNSK
jgi:hypothetical protein